MIRKILYYIIFFCIIFLIMAIIYNFQESKNKTEAKYLQSPDFLLPKGTHTGTLLGSEHSISKIAEIMREAGIIWPDSAKKRLDSTEISKMVEILSDSNFIGDGFYSIACYGKDSKYGHVWHLSLKQAVEDLKKFDTIMRIFPNGTGISINKVKEIFGQPRISTMVEKYQHIVYGNIDLLYDEKRKYFGAIFFFTRSENKSNKNNADYIIN